jgi:hypothetical protein
MAIIAIQRFQGIEAIDLGYGARISDNEWEIDPTLIPEMQGEIGAGREGEFSHLPEIFVRRLEGALLQAWRKSTKFQQANGHTAPRVKDSQAKTLLGHGLRFIRYDNEKEGDYWIHLGVTLLFEDQTEVFCPLRRRILWCSEHAVLPHLNAISFRGETWTEYGGSSDFADHLFSHGH